jgi:hypothetical protein
MSKPWRRRRLRARPLLVAVGAATLAIACENPVLGRTGAPPPDEGAGGSSDLSVPVPPPDMKPSNGD